MRSSQRLAWRLSELIKFVKAQLSSSLATLVDWVLLVLLIAVGVHYLLAILCGAVAGAVTDFTVKKWWVFKPRGGRFEGEVTRYTLVSATSAGLNCLLAYALVDGLGIPKTPGVIAASALVGIAWNYPLHRLFVFQGTRGPSDGQSPHPVRDSRSEI